MRVAPSCTHEWRPAHDVLSHSEDGITTLLSLRTGQYHTLNESGTRLWTMLSACVSLNELNGELVEAQTLIRELAARGLIEHSSTNGSPRGEYQTAVLARG